MILNLTFKDSRLEDEEIVGLLTSFFDVIEQIHDRERKASYYTHFYQERLNKNDRIVISRFLNYVISSLTKENSNFKKNNPSSSGKGSIDESEISLLSNRFFLKIRQEGQKVVSTLAKESSSGHLKAVTTTNAAVLKRKGVKRK